jgi:hypothetical protein
VPLDACHQTVHVGDADEQPLVVVAERLNGRAGEPVDSGNVASALEAIGMIVVTGREGERPRAAGVVHRQRGVDAPDAVR